MFHAEDPNVLQEFSDLNTLIANSPFSKTNKQLPYIKSQYSIFLSSRPPVAEAQAIETVINVCNRTGIKSIFPFFFVSFISFLSSSYLVC